jgi:hypothetical protein
MPLMIHRGGSNSRRPQAAPAAQSDRAARLMFMGGKPSTIEEQINSWLDHLSSATIIKTDTVVTAIAEKPTDGTYPCIVVTIWYEPPELN